MSRRPGRAFLQPSCTLQLLGRLEKKERKGKMMCKFHHGPIKEKSLGVCPTALVKASLDDSNVPPGLRITGLYHSLESLEWQ